MSDIMSQSYHDVMEAYKKPISVRVIPRMISWITIFVLVLGVSEVQALI